MVSPVATEDEVSAGVPLIDVCNVKESDGLLGCSKALLGITPLADMVEDVMIVD